MEFARENMTKVGISKVFLYYYEYFACLCNNFMLFFKKLVLVQFKVLVVVPL